MSRYERDEIRIFTLEKVAVTFLQRVRTIGRRFIYT